MKKLIGILLITIVCFSYNCLAGGGNPSGLVTANIQMNINSINIQTNGMMGDIFLQGFDRGEEKTYTGDQRPQCQVIYTAGKGWGYTFTFTIPTDPNGFSFTSEGFLKDQEHPTGITIATPANFSHSGHFSETDGTMDFTLYINSAKMADNATFVRLPDGTYTGDHTVLITGNIAYN